MGRSSEKKPLPPIKGWRLMNHDGSFNISREGVQRVRITDLYHSLLSMHWSLLFGLTLCAYFFTNFLFGTLYYLCGPGALEGASQVSSVSRFWDSFFFSVQTLATIGYGKVTPHGMLPNFLVTFEALCGLLGVALATGLLFARFARPTAKVGFSRNAILTNHDGVPSFIFRMANRRLNQIVDAQVRVVLARYETTSEGERYRNFYDLELERARNSIFALTWLVVHPITETSPLHGLSHAELAEIESEFIVLLTGIDETFSQTIHARFSYAPEEILCNRKFADILSRDERGLMHVDLNKLHDLEGDEKAP